jgi:hypothetical protein
MSKILIGLAAAGVTAMLTLPAPAVAKERPADGVRNVEQMEFSARRRHRRVVRHYHGPRHVYRSYRPYRYAYGPRYRYRPYYSSYYYPYQSYAYAPYYYRPGPFFSIGPFGIGFGF